MCDVESTMWIHRVLVVISDSDDIRLVSSDVAFAPHLDIERRIQPEVAGKVHQRKIDRVRCIPILRNNIMRLLRNGRSPIWRHFSQRFRGSEEHALLACLLL
jgi:hypothetical protein